MICYIPSVLPKEVYNDTSLAIKNNNKRKKGPPFSHLLFYTILFRCLKCSLETLWIITILSLYSRLVLYKYFVFNMFICHFFFYVYIASVVLLYRACLNCGYSNIFKYNSKLKRMKNCVHSSMVGQTSQKRNNGRKRLKEECHSLQ